MPYKDLQKKKEWTKIHGKECGRKWRKKYPEKYREARKRWRKKNPEKYRMQQQRWRKRYPEKKRMLNMVNRAKRMMAIGSHTLQEWEQLKKKYNYCCAKCGMQEPFTEQHYQRLTEDHMIPLTKGGSNFIENIQPLCQSCNSRKYNKFEGS